MNISALCFELEQEFDFAGDLMASSDACKDYAVKRYLLDTDSPDLCEYFPEAITDHKTALRMLYEFPHVFRAYWGRQVKKHCYSDDLAIPLGFMSEALSSTDYYKIFQLDDSLEFAKEIAEAFYLYAEMSLQEKLRDAYKMRGPLRHCEHECDLADIAYSSRGAI